MKNETTKKKKRNQEEIRKQNDNKQIKTKNPK